MADETTNTLSGWILESASFFYQSNPRLAFFMSTGIAFVYYYLSSVAKKPELYCRAGKFRQVLESKVPILNEKFYPTPWCFGAHSQTAISNFFRDFLPNVKYQRELLETPDGGILALDWLPSDLPQDAPIAFLMAGMTGHSQTEYIRSFIPSAVKQGCRAAVVNYRGRGGVDLKTSKTYCAVSHDDIDIALAHIKNRYPNSMIVACGISLGGVILGQYLSRAQENALVDAAILVSSVFDMSKACVSMELPGLNRFVNRHLAHSLWLTVEPHKDKFKEFQEKCNLDEVKKSTTIREFDERFTSKMFGFDSVDHYYDEATLRNKIHNIKVPTLCVCAADDMFQPQTALPLQIPEENENIAFLVTARGGHIGFMEGILPLLPFFSERLYEQYLSAMTCSIRDGVFEKKQ